MHAHLAFKTAKDMGNLSLRRVGWETLDVKCAGCVVWKVHQVVGLLGLHGGWAAMDIRFQGFAVRAKRLLVQGWPG